MQALDDHQEFEIYGSVINRLFQKGEEETRRQISNAQHGINFTDKQRYFIGKLGRALSHAYYLSKDIQSESILWEVGKGILLTATAAGTAKIGSSLFSSSQFSDVISYTSAVIAATFSITKINNKSEAIKIATKIVNFLENKNDPKFGVYIACELYLEYRIAIEMMVKNEQGIDLLVNYFIAKLLETISAAPNEELQTLSDYEKKLDFIKDRLIIGEIPEKKIKNENHIDYNLEWNLRELLQHSPIIVCLPINREDSYKFTVYLNTAEVKSRNFRTVIAEGSHKYPPRLIYSKNQAIFTSSYSRIKADYQTLPESSLFIPDTLSGAFDMRIEMYAEYIRLFKILREIVRQQDSLIPTIFDNGSELFFKVVDQFNNISQRLLGYIPSSNIACFNLFVDIEMLRNIYWNTLLPLAKKYACGENLKDLPKQEKVKELDANFKNLSIKYSNETMAKQIELSKNNACFYIYDRMKDIPTTSDSREAAMNEADCINKFLSGSKP
jgi:hypothetical protein